MTRCARYADPRRLRGTRRPGTRGRLQARRAGPTTAPRCTTAARALALALCALAPLLVTACNRTPAPAPAGTGAPPAETVATRELPPDPPPSRPFTIIDRPIAFPQERVEMTIAYRKEHQGDATAGMTIVPRVIVVHFTDSDNTAERTWKYFNRPTIREEREDVASASKLNVSAHFLIDRDGTTWRLMPENWMARHCIGLNHVAIGIENVGDAENPLTDAQLDANAALVRELVRRHAELTHLIGHHEYRRMEGHAYFRETDPSYRTDKVDPGPEFMARLRERVSDLELRAPPK